MNYNIHNMVRMKVNGDFKLKPLDMEFEYFRNNEDIEPDIVVNIGKFEPYNQDCYQVDNDYFVKEYYLYHKGKDWEVQIDGFDYNPIVNYNEHMLTKLNMPSCPLTDHILLPIIQRILLEKGYWLTHCAGVGNTLLVGHPHSFKTTLAMGLVQYRYSLLGAKDDYALLGDDYIVLKDNKMLSFPRFPSVFKYRLNHKDDENLNLLDKIRIRLWKKRDYDFIKNEAKVKRIFFLERVNYDCFDVVKIDSEEAKRRIFINQEIEDSYSMFSRYKTIYKSIFPIKELKPKINLNVPSYVVRFSENNIDKVVDLCM